MYFFHSSYIMLSRSKNKKKKNRKDFISSIRRDFKMKASPEGIMGCWISHSALTFLKQSCHFRPQLSPETDSTGGSTAQRKLLQESFCVKL